MKPTERQMAFLEALRDHGSFYVPYNAPIRSLARIGLVDVRSWNKDSGGVVWSTEKGNALVDAIRNALEDKA